ncbi:hypothetical protein C8Q76DRAFT_309951 [Earliella scabrosa]|nr:hypothetical protein C8Q76DRAFT_309951 [Earliella scabrosa]
MSSSTSSFNVPLATSLHLRHHAALSVLIHCNRYSSSSSTLLVDPSPVARFPPRLSSLDYQLTLPDRSSSPKRRHSTISSPMYSARPLRSSPLAGPSIAVTGDGALVGAASAPPTPGGGVRHLSPLAEFSVIAAEESGDAESAAPKKQRRRSLGGVLSKISFPISTATSESEQPSGEPSKPRRRSKSASAHAAPPVPAVPPLPAWAQNGSNSPSRLSQHNPSPSASRAPSSTGSSIRSIPSRPSSPTPSARSTSSRKSVFQQVDPRTGSPMRLPPSTSRNPEENWLTQSSAPRFSRLGLKAEGVILPVSAREARRRSTASTLNARAKSLEARPRSRPTHTRSSSGASAASSARSLAAIPGSGPSCSSSVVSSPSPAAASRIAPPPPAPSPAPSTIMATPPFRSRTSSFASATSSRPSLDRCDTPSLTMSPAASASDLSLPPPLPTTPQAQCAVDEFGALSASHVVQLQLNDVHVESIPVPVTNPEDEFGKARDVGGFLRTTDSIASVGSIGSRAGSLEENVVVLESPTKLKSGRGSVFRFGIGGRGGYPTSTVGPEGKSRTGDEPECPRSGSNTGASATMGRVWKQVVRSVTGAARRSRS